MRCVQILACLHRTIRSRFPSQCLGLRYLLLSGSKSTSISPWPSIVRKYDMPAGHHLTHLRGFTDTVPDLDNRIGHPCRLFSGRQSLNTAQFMPRIRTRCTFRRRLSGYFDYLSIFSPHPARSANLLITRHLIARATTGELSALRMANALSFRAPTNSQHTVHV